MASTRSRRTSTSAAKPATTPSAALTTVAREGARIQLAAISAAGGAFSAWAGATDRLAHTVGKQVLSRVDGETDSRQLIVGVAAATTAHLDELASLPRAAANRFDERLSRASTTPRRHR
jgi:hypothetical protein